jgi:hypothetical protein
MDYHPPSVSVTAPVELAMERTRQILFRPFDFSKWIAIGFCAWLAYLGQGGFNYNRNYHRTTSSHGTFNSSSFAPVRAYWQNNQTWIVPLAIGVFIVVLALVVLMVWLQSRGSFMLLHCVAHNRGEVAIPWTKFAREAHSLWLFKLALAAIGLILFLPIFGCGIWIFSNMFVGGHGFDPAKVPLLIGLGLAWLCVGVPLGVISVFTRHFVVPIMYLNGGTCMDGWRVLIPVLEANPGRFVLYLLFQIVIGIVIVFLIIAFAICTCCIGGLLLVIPFVGSVVRLPITVFSRSYSLYYLAQYRPEFDVFRLEEPPGTGPALAM